MGNPLDILCIGNALVDIFAHADGGVLESFNITAPVQHIAMPDLLAMIDFLPGYRAVSGGGAANVAKISSLLGVSTGFVGTVGSAWGDSPDHFGATFRGDLESAGVTPLLNFSGKPTGLCLMLERSDGGASHIIASPGAALDLFPEQLSPELFQGPKVVVLDGYILGRDALVQRILELAAQNSAAIALDVGSAALASRYREQIRDWCGRYPVYLFMNLEEAQAFCQVSPDPGEASPWATASGLNPALEDCFCSLSGSSAFPYIVVKQGKAGAALFSQGKIYREPVEPLDVEEATGAGDSFCAAFLAGILHGRSLSDCVRLGNQVAGIALSAYGSALTSEHLQGISI